MSAYDQLLGAIQTGDAEAIRILASNEPPLNDHDVLHYAAHLGNSSVVRTLLQHGWGKRINDFDDVSFTPLMWAAKQGHLEVVQTLLAAGADVNARDKPRIGNTALRECVEKATQELIRTLLNAGADPALRGWMNLNAIDKAKERLEAENSEVAAEILSLLTSPLKDKLDSAAGC